VDKFAGENDDLVKSMNAISSQAPPQQGQWRESKDEVNLIV